MKPFITPNKLKRSQAPLRPFDRILEGTILCLAVALLMCTIAFYLKSPDTVATHFDAAGKGNDWGPKSFFWLIGLSGLVVIGILVLAAYFPQMINIPVKLRPEVLPRQHQLMGELVRLVAVDVSVMFILIETMMACVTPSEPQAPTLLVGLLGLTTIVLITLIIAYIWRIYQVN
jgi:uncharacterized membrane protein